jgi:hypothetical protein
MNRMAGNWFAIDRPVSSTSGNAAARNANVLGLRPLTSAASSARGIRPFRACMAPAPFASFLFVMSKWSACMCPACNWTIAEAPAALMRSAHPVLSKIAAYQKEQPARKTGFRMLVQPASSSLFRSFANQRWWYSALKTVCLRGDDRRNITGLAAEQRLDDSRILVGQCDRSAIVSASGDHLLQPDAMWIGFT